MSGPFEIVCDLSNNLTFLPIKELKTQTTCHSCRFSYDRTASIEGLGRCEVCLSHFCANCDCGNLVMYHEDAHCRIAF